MLQGGSNGAETVYFTSKNSFIFGIFISYRALYPFNSIQYSYVSLSIYGLTDHTLSYNISQGNYTLS